MSTALFMDLVDTAALGTALPVMSREFGTSPLNLKFALTAYLFVAAMLVPASGWMADRWGARRMFLLAVLVFLTGSILCALSNSLTALVMARTVQGIGGGMMTPVGRLIVLGSTARAELVRALNWFTIPAMIGPLVGPPLAGLLVEHASWRWIFLINLPVGAVGLIALHLLVPPMVKARPAPFDYRGFVLISVSIACIVALSETVGGTLSTGQWLALSGVAIATIWAAVRHAARVDVPALDFSLFRIRTFRTSMIGGALLRLGIGASPLLMPLLLQSALHWSPFEAGLMILSGTIGALTSRFAIVAVLRKLGFRRMLVAAGAATAIASAAPGFFQLHLSPVFIVAAIVATGLTRTIYYGAASALAFADIPVHLTSRASTLSTVVQQITLSLGVSLGAGLLHLSSTLSGGGALSPHQFMLPFLMIGLLGLLALPGHLSLPEGVAQDMSGRGGRGGGSPGLA